MNPPHFGGIWERIIQTAKRTLLIVLGNQQLKAETFQTIVTETEGILNSRPITYVSADNNDEQALTPNHFILRRPHLALAPPQSEIEKFQEERFQPYYTNAFGPLLEKTSKGVHIRPNKQSKMERTVETAKSWRFSLDSERIYARRYLAPRTNKKISLRSRWNTKII